MDFVVGDLLFVVYEIRLQFIFRLLGHIFKNLNLLAYPGVALLHHQLLFDRLLLLEPWCFGRTFDSIENFFAKFVLYRPLSNLSDMLMQLFP